MIQLKLLQKLCCILALMISMSFAEQPCITPYRTIGICVPHEECSYVQEHLKSFRHQYEINAYLRQGLCDITAEVINICCMTGYTLSEIPATIDLLTTTTTTKKPLHKSNSAYEASLNPNAKEVLRKQNCGQTNNNHLANGVVAKLDEYPWMAVMRYNETVETPTVCSGSLITERFILTAAHCVCDLPVIGVKLGVYNLNKTKVCSGVNQYYRCSVTENYDIEKIIIHGNYSAVKKVFDIALIKLKTDVEFKRNIMPVCLPIRSTQLNMRNKELTVAGWGLTETDEFSAILQKAKLPYRVEEECRNQFIFDYNSESHICIGRNNTTLSCRGNSGSPFFMVNTFEGYRRYIQYAIVSNGGSRCEADDVALALSTNVIKLMPWITDKIAEN